MLTSIWYYQSLTVHNQFVLSLLVAEITLINQQFAAVCQFNSCTVYRKDGSTIALLENYRSETIGRNDCHPIVWLSADTIVRWDYHPNPSHLSFLSVDRGIWVRGRDCGLGRLQPAELDNCLIFGQQPASNLKSLLCSGRGSVIPGPAG